MNLNGKQVRVYFNLHKRLFSVQIQVTKEVNGKKRKQWLVIAHTNKITLTDVQFKVSESGRQRVLKEQKKNVHAFVYGTVCHDWPFYTNDLVSYSPYKGNSFYIKHSDIPVSEAKFAILNLVEGYKPQIRV